MVKILTDDDFMSVIKESSVPVLVDFYADWCGPCKMAGPIVEQIAVELEGKALVCKMNIDQCPITPAQFNVSSIPCFVAFSNGKESHRQVGFSGKPSIMKLVTE